MKLIRLWLETPVKEDEGKGGKERGANLRKPDKGTPQGGVISPLLSNLYLHWFDEVFHRPSGPGKWANAKLVRYADDFVILARYIDGKIINWVERKIEKWMDLKINREKTRVVNLHEERARFDFLGYTYHFDCDLYGRDRKYLNMEPSKKAIQKERDKLREMINGKQSHTPLPDLIQRVNVHLEGWQNYFNQGYPTKAWRKINYFVRRRLIRHLRRRSQRPWRPPKGQTAHEFLKEMNLIYLRKGIQDG